MEKNLVREYFLEKGFNCSESMLRAANDYYGLGLNEESLRLAGGFGGGMGAGGACGALCGAIQAIAAMMIMEQESSKSSACPGFREACAAYYNAFAEQLGSSECRDLTPKYKKPDTRCYELMEKAWALLEEAAAKAGRKPVE